MGNGGINANHRTALGNSFQGVVPVSLGPMHLHALMRIDFIGLKAYCVSLSEVRCSSISRPGVQLCMRAWFCLVGCWPSKDQHVALLHH